MRELVVKKNDANQRLDKFLLKKFKTMPKKMAYMYIRKKCVKVNGKKATPEVMLKENDLLTFYIKDEFFDNIQEENYEFLKAPKTLKIIYEDENIILLDKKPGVIVHQDKSYHFDCLLLRLQHYLYDNGEYNPKEENCFAPALVNRIDRNTGGIVIGAKNAESLRILNQKMKDRELHKFYLCLLINRPKKDNAILSDYLIKNEKTNKVTVLRNEKQGAKKILTKYSVLETNNNLTLCEVELLTGRTHQIRAHMSSIGCPILGDNKYGNKKLNQKYSLSKQCLYSYKLSFDFTTDSGILSYLDKKEFSTNDIWFMDYLK
ncbi:MAG: RluA family pseudouridine synthase [Ruminococcus sp.]|nr:RluA family pseudouridine synthase [Ruminococcus sp.]MCI5597916.1 RluA family pseudouridine synthase [Ruminococcus sp.]